MNKITAAAAASLALFVGAIFVPITSGCLVTVGGFDPLAHCINK